MAARSLIFPKKQPKPQPVEEALPPDEDTIRRRAYELYLQRGGQAGSETEDWLHAEAELNALRRTR